MNTTQTIIAALALVAAVAIGYNLKTEPVVAQESANGMIALQLDPGSQDSAFALINTEQKVIMIYKSKYSTSAKKTSLELEAVRSYRFDEGLEQWKTEPKLSDIEKAVKAAQARK